MTAPVPDALCLKQTHRCVDKERLFQRLYLTTGIADLPGKLSAGARAFSKARLQLIDDPTAERGAMLRAARLPARLLPALEAAYQLEPSPTRFGAVAGTRR